MRCIIDAALLTDADAPIKRIDEFSAEALPTNLGALFELDRARAA